MDIFEEPVAAISARKLGNTLLTKAMSVRHEIRFASYDRMFPNQDFMPKGGFGNLIALPLQGGARKEGNSEFVDEHFESYPDQWEYLSSVKKMTSSEIQNLLDTLCVGNGLGELGNAMADEEETLEPWAAKKPEIKLERDDFTDHLTVIEANRLYIPKEGISQRALNRIKRLAAFQNPLFYKTQKMRMSTYGIPRIISSLDETDKYIGIPRGCHQALSNLLESSGIKYSFEDKRNSGRQIKVDFTGTLREEQQLAANALLDYENGILALPTAFGKTVIGASLIANRKCNTLILVHLQTLLDQWQKSLGQFLEIHESLPEPEKKRGRKKIRLLIGQIGSGKNTSSGIVDIALVQSLIHENEVDDIVKNYGMIIVDECHHASSLNFERVLGAANARYVYGLTATPNRQDGQHPIVFMQCGPIRYGVSAKEQAGKRNFEHFVVPCFTKFRQSHTQNAEDWHITKIYAALSEDEVRNDQIIADVIQAVNDNRTPITLTQRTEHVMRLATMLDSCCDARVITLVGANSAKDKKKMAESLDAILPDEKLIIVATGKYIGEGFDYPRLDTLFLASPIAWKGTLAQYAGRLHREYPGKRDVIVYDYVDIHIPVLERMYHKRLKGYAAIGYKALSGSSSPDKVGMIYDADNYASVIANDLVQTRKEIIISSPYIQKKQVDTVLEWLSSALSSGVAITIITQPAESYKDSERAQYNIDLLKTKATVILKPDISQRFTIIDNQLVWYGSIGLLCRGSSEDSIMRLYSRELATELKEITGY
ncbi:DEAD/DEAH box helicase family protein [Alistipes sp. OttesenSCG-928-B03]|nr:DEAD/DEAH box helicase family protein [Alistipes sp. OttesenSCG-928-B03]